MSFSHKLAPLPFITPARPLDVSGSSVLYLISPEVFPYRFAILPHHPVRDQAKSFSLIDDDSPDSTLFASLRRNRPMVLLTFCLMRRP